MHVYEAKNPYYAMIVANDKDACADFYGEIVTDIECREDFMSEVEKLPLTLAVDKLSKTVSEDNISTGILLVLVLVSMKFISNWQKV